MIKNTCRVCGNTWLGNSKLCQKCGSCNSYAEIPPLPLEVKREIRNHEIVGNFYQANKLREKFNSV